MKKLLFLLAFAASLFALSTQVVAQGQAKIYGQVDGTFRLDTLAGTDNANFVIPLSFDQNTVSALATWQVRLTRIGGTLTVNCFLEESVDDAASSPDYVTVATIASAVAIDGTTTERFYLTHAPVRGKKQRLRFTSTGSGASAILEVDCLLRNKHPLTVTDEF